MSGSVPPRLIQPSREFYIFGAPGSVTSLPSGDAAFDTRILYKSFVRAADLLILEVVVYANPGDDGFITFSFPTQHLVETQQDTAPPLAPNDSRVTFWGYDYLNAPPGAFVWPAPNASRPKGRLQTWWGDLDFTQGTRICFYLAFGAGALLASAEAGDLATLLDWADWPICLPPWGLSNAAYGQAPLASAATIPASQAEAEVASTLAMIFGLVLTQTDTAGWTHLDQPAPLQGRTELWHTRLAATQTLSPPTLRAIWSLPQAVGLTALWDHLPGSTAPGDPTNAFEPNTALTSGTVAQGGPPDLRVELVQATSALGASAIELPAHDVLLSAMGGSLTTGSETVAHFHHQQVLGRDIDDSSLVIGHLLPFGHPVTVMSHRVRKVDANGFASLTDITTLRVINPVVSAPMLGLQQPFGTITLLNTTIPPFPDLEHLPAMMLDYVGTDYAGRGIRLQSPLALTGLGPPSQIVLVNQQRVTYAPAFVPPRAPGIGASDLPSLPSPASLVTDQLTVLAHAPGAFAVTQAQIRHAAVAQFRTDAAAAAAVALTVVPPSIVAGATAEAMDVLALITGSVDAAGNIIGLPTVTAAAQNTLAGLGAGALDTSRFGAFAAPQLTPALLSKTFGAAGATLDQLTAAATAGEAQLKAAAQQAINDLLGETKLFGLFRLKDLLGSVLEQTQQTVDQVQGWVAQNGPQLAELMDDTTKTVTLTLNATPPADGGLFTVKESAGFLDVTLTAATIAFTSTVTTSLADPTRSLTTANGTIGSPTVMLDLSSAGVSISFTELVFTSASNAKPHFTTGFNGFSFTGDLAFINGIMAVLPSSVFSNPPQTTIDDTHAEVSCSVGLPSFGFGVFDFSNIGLGADAVIRFDPSAAAVDGDPDQAPLEFSFDFGTPDAPFSCAVSLLEGQGSFGLDVTPSGVTIDCSMAFGGAFKIDLVVVSGGVSITAGLHLTKKPQTLDIAGFVHLSGGVEVLDIVGVTLDAMLMLSYSSENREFTGSVQVTIGISVLFFHQDVSFGLTESFSLDSPGSLVARPGALPAAAAAPPNPFAPRPSPVLGYANVWNDYCAGFAA